MPDQNKGSWWEVGNDQGKVPSGYTSDRSQSRPHRRPSRCFDDVSLSLMGSLDQVVKWGGMAYTGTV